MELTLSIDDFRYIRNIRILQLINGEYCTAEEDSRLIYYIDRNLINKICIRKFAYNGRNYSIYYYQDDNIVLTQNIHENNNSLIEDLSRKMRYEKRKEVLENILD